jgi:hypothetical protein
LCESRCAPEKRAAARTRIATGWISSATEVRPK